MKKQWIGATTLLIAAFIWGSSFVAMSIGMEQIEAFTFNSIRTLLGATLLLPIVVIRDIRIYHISNGAEKELFRKTNIQVWRSGFILGIVLCVASSFQQYAFNYSTSGKIAFLTALYILFVPLISLFLGRKVPLFTWVCIAIGAIGVWFLSIPSGSLSRINQGDIMAFVCAVFYAIHIILIGILTTKNDPVKLTFIQFLISGLLSILIMFLFESPSLHTIRAALWPLLYSGVLSYGVGFTFQTIGQKYISSEFASLIMCMESVFSVLSAAIILHEIPSSREWLGCTLMFFSIVSLQILTIIKKKKPDFLL